MMQVKELEESGVYKFHFDIISKKLKMRLSYQNDIYTQVEIAGIESGLYIHDVTNRKEYAKEKFLRISTEIQEYEVYADMTDFCVKTPINILFNDELIAKTSLGFCINTGLFNFNAREIYIDGELIKKEQILFSRRKLIEEKIKIDVLDKYWQVNIISLIVFPVEGKLELLIQDSNRKEKKIIFDNVLSYFYTTNVNVQQNNELLIGKIINIQEAAFEVEKNNEVYITQFSSEPNYYLSSNDIVIYVEADTYRITEQ